jgi:hypothetical protein
MPSPDTFKRVLRMVAPVELQSCFLRWRHAVAEVTIRLRALKPRSRKAVLTALVETFATVAPQDIRGWFRHCGYRVAST